MTEIWKKIEGYPQYLISNNNGWKNTNRIKQPKGRISHGYRTVILSKTKEERYHILVAKAFPEICGEWFDGCHVHHINFDKLDNRPENLIVLTPREHTKLHYQYQGDNFKKPSAKRNKSISKALTGRRATEKHIPILQYSLKGDFIKEWECISDVKVLGYSPSNICSCCKGQLRQSYGYIWKYKNEVA